jgi:hypothetical protein
MRLHHLLTSTAQISLPRSTVISTERRKYPPFLPFTRSPLRTQETTTVPLHAKRGSTYPHQAHQNPTSTSNRTPANLDGSDQCVTFPLSMKTEEEEDLCHGAAATFLSCAKPPQAYETRTLRIRKSSGEAKSHLTARFSGMSILANRHPMMLARLRVLPRVLIKKVHPRLQHVFERPGTM